MSNTRKVKTNKALKMNGPQLVICDSCKTEIGISGGTNVHIRKFDIAMTVTGEVYMTFCNNCAEKILNV